MKPLVAKLTLAALVAAPLVAPAQHHLRPADKLGSLTLLPGPHTTRPADKTGSMVLLPGPHLLSPADATGEVVPGQMWKAIYFAPGAAWPVGPTTVVSGSGFTFRQLSGPVPASRGTLSLGKSPEPMPEARRLAKPPAKPVDPETLRFNVTLPKTEIRPLQQKTAPPPADLKSL